VVEIKYDVRKGADIYRSIYASRLRSWVSTGKINLEEVLVWRSGLSGWRKPEQLEELRPYFEQREEEQLRLRRKEDAVKPRLFPKKRVKNILIIDDEGDLCWLLSNTLRKKGYTVSTANTISDGTTRLKEAPDLLFLDLKLPDGDGMDLLPRIKEITPQTLVVIISAYGSEEKSGEAKGEGAYSFVDKPFSEEKILEVMGQIQCEGQ